MPSFPRLWIAAACAALLSGCVATRPAAEVQQPDLVQLFQRGQLKLVNRDMTVLTPPERAGLRFGSRPLDGLAWLPGVAFRNGSVEFDVRGKDVLQRSFVGLAFHGQNDSTFEAVYFRPFNFRHADPVRRSHAVQYEALPENPWNRLRREQPDRYEAPLTAPPEPNGWFHVRVQVQASWVEVFVDHSPEPSLRVEALRPAAGTRLGLYVGDNSDGDFANLRIRPQP